MRSRRLAGSTSAPATNGCCSSSAAVGRASGSRCAEPSLNAQKCRQSGDPRTLELSEGEVITGSGTNRGAGDQHALLLTRPLHMA